MCKKNTQCKECKQKSNEGEDEMSDAIVCAAITGGAYYAGAKFIPQLNVPKERLMQQTGLVAGAELAQGTIDSWIRKAAPSSSSVLNKIDYLVPVEIGALYSLGTSYAIKVDDRPMLIKFLHAAGASAVGSMLYSEMPAEAAK